MSENKMITLPPARNKGVSRGVAIALAFCFFGLGVAAKSALTPPTLSPGGTSLGMPGGMPGGLSGGIPGGGMMGGGGAPGGAMPGLKGTVSEVASDHYVLKTEMGMSFEVPLDSKSSVKVGDVRELKIK